MKIWQILANLVLAQGVTFAAIEPQPESTANQVSTVMQKLQQDLLIKKDSSEKFQSLRKSLDDLRFIKDNDLALSSQQDAQMDLMVAALESLPQEKNFKKKDCLRYENDLLNQFEPLADEHPEEPALQPAWSVLQSLCR